MAVPMFALAKRPRAAAVVAALTAAALIPTAVAFGEVGVRPGAVGIGDPYFPQDGNGGYDVSSYALDLRMDPRKNGLEGVATIAANATHGLTQFNLDLDGLTVSKATVNGVAATFTQRSGELTVKPAVPVLGGTRMTVVVTYAGKPARLKEQFGGGPVPTPSGVIFLGEPHSASTWFPVNDHPLDTASYTTHLTVPKGLRAISNGLLQGTATESGWTTWTWHAAEPMAPYLAMAAVGEFDVRSYTKDGISFYDAVDHSLAAAFRPRTGKRFAIAGGGDTTYQRLTRTIAVPKRGAKLSFSVRRTSEPQWDFFFVEARTAGRQDWTTLRDQRGHTSKKTGDSCPYWLTLHPFLKHYQSKSKDGCAARGSSGRWWAATGLSEGYERWTVDLSRYAGRSVEVSLAYANDDLLSLPGAVVDDIVSTTGEGTTSFERDRNSLDGWSVGAPPRGTPRKSARWSIGTAADAPTALGKVAFRTLRRQPEIIAFLAGIFGPYPFSAAGGIVTSAPLGFALETQTRSIYGPLFFGDREEAESVIVHETTHQWFGDDLPIAAWRHIWLNEGFASYAQWLWADRERIKGLDAQFAEAWKSLPAKDPFWELRIDDPGPEHLFDGPVYTRGAMTLHQLRQVVGEEAFFSILRKWAGDNAGRHVTTEQFIELAERISGKDLGEFFRVWLSTPVRPPLPGPGGPAPR